MLLSVSMLRSTIGWLRHLHASLTLPCRFKLALASGEERSAVVAATAVTEATDGVAGELPLHLSTQKFIGDFLRFIRDYAVSNLKRHIQAALPQMT